jgi:hypothetical protein
LLSQFKINKSITAWHAIRNLCSFAGISRQEEHPATEFPSSLEVD